jgi:hypothetical protein
MVGSANVLAVVSMVELAAALDVGAAVAAAVGDRVPETFPRRADEPVGVSGACDRVEAVDLAVDLSAAALVFDVALEDALNVPLAPASRPLPRPLL